MAISQTLIPDRMILGTGHPLLPSSRWEVQWVKAGDVSGGAMTLTVDFSNQISSVPTIRDCISIEGVAVDINAVGQTSRLILGILGFEQYQAASVALNYDIGALLSYTNPSRSAYPLQSRELFRSLPILRPRSGLAGLQTTSAQVTLIWDGNPGAGNTISMYLWGYAWDSRVWQYGHPLRPDEAPQLFDSVALRQALAAGI